MKAVVLLKERNGSILLGVLALTTIMIIGGVAFLSLHQSRDAMSKTVRQNTVAALTMRQIEKIFSNPVACTNNLGGLNPSASPTVANIKTFNSTIVYNTTDPINRNIQITQMRITNNGTAGEARLVVDFIRLGSFAGPANFVRSLDVKKSPPAGAITDCVAKGVASLDNLATFFDGGAFVGTRFANPVINSDIEAEAIGASGIITGAAIILPSGVVPTSKIESGGLFSVGGSVMTGTASVVGSAAVSSTLSANNLIVSGVFLANSIRATTQFCTLGQCTDFSMQNCPAGSYLNGIYANGSLQCQAW